MDNWIVLQWSHSSFEPAYVVFKGSEKECRVAAREMLKVMPQDLDCMAVSEASWNQDKGMLRGGVSDEQTYS